MKNPEANAKIECAYSLKQLYTPEAIGCGLKNLRQIRGRSAISLANDACIDPSYYSSIENGRCYVSLEKICSLCSCLNLPLSGFFLMVESHVTWENIDKISSAREFRR